MTQRTVMTTKFVICVKHCDAQGLTAEVLMIFLKSPSSRTCMKVDCTIVLQVEEESQMLSMNSKSWSAVKPDS